MVMNKMIKKFTRQPKESTLPFILMTLMTIITAVSLSIVLSAGSNIEVRAVQGQDDLRPVGSSIEGYWTTAPAGYLLEDGGTYNCNDYQNLCAVLGGTPGSTFTVPDSRGKALVAQSTTEGEFNTLGETGGEKTVTLSTSNLPAHDHTFNGRTILWGNGGGNVRFREDNSDADRIIAIGGATPASNGMYACNGCTNWNDTGNTGSGGAHNNLMPYIVLNRAIKY